MKRVWQSNEPLRKHTGYFKMSYNPMGYIVKEISKKIKKTA